MTAAPKYVPISLTHIPHLVANGRLRADVAFVQVSPPDARRRRHARYDLGRVPNETLKHLRHLRDLGIHSNVITDPILDLIEQGVITGRHKTLHPGKIVTSLCIGSQRWLSSVPSTVWPILP